MPEPPIEYRAPESTEPISTGSVDDAVLIGLLRSIGSGDETALERLYDASAHSLYALALWRTGSPEDAADVVQEVFVRVARHRDRLVEIKSPRAWLLTVARRLAVDVGRRRSRTTDAPQEAAALLEAPAHDPSRAVDAERAAALLRTLPPPQREVIYLRHFEGLSFAAIGRVAGVPTFTAASRYRLGIARLRRLLEKNR